MKFEWWMLVLLLPCFCVSLVCVRMMQVIERALVEQDVWSTFIFAVVGAFAIFFYIIDRVIDSPEGDKK